MPAAGLTWSAAVSARRVPCRTCTRRAVSQWAFIVHIPRASCVLVPLHVLTGGALPVPHFQPLERPIHSDALTASVHRLPGRGAGWRSTSERRW